MWIYQTAEPLFEFLEKFVKTTEKSADCKMRELVCGSWFIEEARCDALCAALRDRVDMLAKIVNGHRTSYAIDSCQGDVEEDTAYSGSLD